MPVSFCRFRVLSKKYLLELTTAQLSRHACSCPAALPQGGRQPHQSANSNRAYVPGRVKCSKAHTFRSL
jgi:hypothetical protein